MEWSRMTTCILIAMILGIAAGWLIHKQFVAPATQKLIGGYISIGSMISLRLIKMIIASLVFSTLVAGIGHTADAGEGRVDGKAMVCFVTASLVSLSLRLVLIHLVGRTKSIMTAAHAASGLPVMVHLDGLPRVRLK